MRRLLLIALALLPGAELLGQAAPSPVRLIPMRVAPDTVLLYLLGDLPPSGTAMVIRTAGITTDTLAVATLRAAVDPAALRIALGDGFDALRRTFRVADEVELMRRVTADAFAQSITAAVSRPAAMALGRLFVDAAAPAAGEVAYRVELAGNAQPSRTLTARLAATDPGLRAIPVATRLRLEANAVRLRLTWTETRAADEWHVGYHVYRRIGNGAVERLTELPLVRLDGRTPFYEDLELQEGATYRYQVRTVDLAGREGAASVAESLTVRDRTAPSAPREVAARRDAGRVLVTWTPSTDADVAGYHVERAPGIDKPYRRLTPRLLPRDTLIFADATVPVRQQHFWRVLAVDAAGNVSIPSNAASGTAEDTVPPAPPTNLSARAVQRRIVLNWSPSASRDVRGYHIYRGDDSTRLVRLTQRPFEGRAYIDSTTDGRGLRPGGSYVVRIVAVDSTLNESAPVTARVAVPDDEAPEPPTGLVARDEQGRYMELTWSASPSPDVRTYLVTRRDSGAVRVAGTPPADSVFIARITTVTAAPWSVRDTLPKVHGRVYLYSVTPVDTAGNVGRPAVARMNFAEHVPPPSVRFAAATLLPNGAGVRVRWERVVDRELVGYHVYRSNLPTGDFQRRTTRPVTLLEFTDAGADGTWWYVVRAVDASGNESSASRPVRGLP